MKRNQQLQDRKDARVKLRTCDNIGPSFCIFTKIKPGINFWIFFNSLISPACRCFDQSSIKMIDLLSEASLVALCPVLWRRCQELLTHDNPEEGELYLYPERCWAGRLRPGAVWVTYLHAIVPFSLPKSPWKPDAILTHIATCSVLPSSHWLHFHAHPELTETLCLYDSVMKHGGIFCRCCARSLTWCHQTFVCVVSISYVHPLCSEAVSLHWLLHLFFLFLLKWWTLGPSLQAAFVTPCPMQTQFTGSKMCISYATTTKNKDANALIDRLGLLFCLHFSVLLGFFRRKMTDHRDRQLINIDAEGFQSWSKHPDLLHYPVRCEPSPVMTQPDPLPVSLNWQLGDTK